MKWCIAVYRTLQITSETSHILLNTVYAELPQELKETQERVSRLQEDAVTRSDVENEARRRDADEAESKIRKIGHRTDTIQSISEVDHRRVDELQQQLATAVGTLNQVRFANGFGIEVESPFFNHLSIADANDNRSPPFPQHENQFRRKNETGRNEQD